MVPSPTGKSELHRPSTDLSYGNGRGDGNPEAVADHEEGTRELRFPWRGDEVGEVDDSQMVSLWFFHG